MAALWLIFYLRYDTDRQLAIRIFRAVGFVMVMLIPSTYNPQTSYLAHGMGFLIGLGAGILLLPIIEIQDPREDERRLRLLTEGDYYSDHGEFRGKFH